MNLFAFLIALLFAIGIVLSGIFFGTRWLYYCRVPLLLLSILVLLPVAAISFARSLALGVYDLSAWDGVLVALLLALAIRAAFSTTLATVEQGPRRFNARPASSTKHFFLIVLSTTGAVYLLNLVAILTATDRKDWWPVLAGYLLTAALLTCVNAVFFKLDLPSAAGGWEETELGQRQSALAWVDRISKALVKLVQFLAGKVLFGFNPSATPSQLRKRFLRGFLSRNKDGRYDLAPEHAAATAWFGLWLVIYLFSFFLGRGWSPALGYVLILLCLLTWLGAGLAFYLDRYKIPVLAPVLGWSLLMGNCQYSDHAYRVAHQTKPATTSVTQASATPNDQQLSAITALANIPADSPAAVLGRAPDHPFVLVCAAGGGIRAAAWTTRVLTGLETLIGGDDGKRFCSSIRLMSGVSGGSVGLMFYVEGRYGAGAKRDAKQAAELINRTSVQSSLASAIRGLAYQDLWRVMLPFLVSWDRFDDRAYSLEEAWLDHARKHIGQGLPEASLNAWRQLVVAGSLPAIIFSATVVETGERFTFSTAPCVDPSAGERDFFATYPSRDVAISTAARLSATFPFISPTAQPLLGGSIPNADVAQTRSENTEKLEPFHLVDGGYYDNSGLGALSRWLDDGLKTLAALAKNSIPRRILVIQIVPAKAAPANQANSQNDYQQGPLFQFLSPVKTVWSVRETANGTATDRDFAFVAKRWELENLGSQVDWFQPAEPAKAQGNSPAARTIPGVQIVKVIFPYPADDSDSNDDPLSWHLSDGQAEQIDRYWNRLKDGPEVKLVQRFFADPLPGAP
jgi:Patatin-like phospholipase